VGGWWCGCGGASAATSVWYRYMGVDTI